MLDFMLLGLEVEPNPSELKASGTLKIVHQGREYVVVDKPAGMLSAEGLISQKCVSQVLAEEFGMSGYEPVNRLDQATSGLLVLARKGSVYKELQRQFAEHEVKKEYEAVLDGVLTVDSAEVRLPLMPDYFDRPRQKVDFNAGKEAVSYVKVLNRGESQTLVRLQPITGRTHQLRVHCAHAQGLDTPILGDTLYGRAGSASRLMLHCCKIEFRDPETGEMRIVESESGF